MKPLIRIIGLLIRGERRAILQGLALSLIVLVMGASLLGLSGWFITAAAAAGMAGIGILFNFFIPSAMVRLLALGRTAARYGERLATHDAVLRALSALRIRLLNGLLGAPYRQLERLRADAMLNRVTADVDALDGALLRLVLPGLAGAAAILLATVVLWWLVHPAVALVVGSGYLLLPNLVFFAGQRIARRPSRQAEAALQASRSRLVELISAREDLTVNGQLANTVARAGVAVARHAAARSRLDGIERITGLGLDLIGAAVTAAALGIGAELAMAGTIEPAQAAIGIFVSLALSEATAPIRRALAEIGRMVQAARRILPAVEVAASAPRNTRTGAQRRDLQIEAMRYRPRTGATDLFAPLTLTVAPGETVALTGASGSGKSTVLLIAAGALPASSGQVTLGGDNLSDVDPQTLYAQLAMVPQRHGLIAGSVAENLRLAAPGAEDAALWSALKSACLADTVEAKGGLDAPLGYRGAGLSGGEARRLVLARAILRQPDVLLLDEPTEGLDDATARKVMAGLRTALPQTAILMAAHRAAEIENSDRVIPLQKPEPTAQFS